MSALSPASMGIRGSRDDASVTVITSTGPTPPSTRGSSVDGQKEGHLRVMEQTPAHGGRSPPYLNHELDASYMSVVIVLCFFVSGLVDSVAFNSWSCFVNMQTGNTVFAALGLSGQPKASHSQQYYKSLTSIGAFCLGTLIFNSIHRYPTGLANQPSARRRWIFALSFSVQTLLMVVAALMVSLGLVSNQPFKPGLFSSGSAAEPPATTNFLDLCPVFLLSFQAAGQVTLSRLLSLVELPTIVLSALYHDFAADLLSLCNAWKKTRGLWELLRSQRRQCKRFACIVALFVGGFVGGEMYKSPAGMAGALWMAAGLKLAIAAGWLVWKKAADEDLQDQSLC